MKVVIDVPNWLYHAIQEHREPIYSQSLGEAVRDGTPLPKGYGRLIDGDRLIRPEIQPFLYHLENGDTAIPEIDILHAPTIIEADKDGDAD